MNITRGGYYRQKAKTEAELPIVTELDENDLVRVVINGVAKNIRLCDLANALGVLNDA